MAGGDTRLWGTGTCDACSRRGSPRACGRPNTQTETTASFRPRPGFLRRAAMQGAAWRLSPGGRGWPRASHAPHRPCAGLQRLPKIRWPLSARFARCRDLGTMPEVLRTDTEPPWAHVPRVVRRPKQGAPWGGPGGQNHLMNIKQAPAQLRRTLPLCFGPGQVDDWAHASPALTGRLFGPRWPR